jgi:HK97 family phage major capsid protein
VSAVAPAETVERLRASIASRRAAALELKSALVTLGAAESDTPSARASVDSIIDELEDLERREQVLSRVEVVREPLTYSPEAPRSFFQDFIRAKAGARLGQIDVARTAEARLERHAEEMRVEFTQRADIERRRFEAGLANVGASFEKRTNPNRTDGTGGYLVPPLWLIDRSAAAPLAGRPLAALIGSLPLPTGTDSINVPRFVVNPAASVQTADAAPVTGTDFTDAAVSSGVETIAGRADVSLQLLEQTASPGLDVVVWSKMTENYDAQLETQLLAGTGANGQLLGLANVSSITSVAYTSGSPTVNGAQVAILQAAAQLFDARLRPAEAAFMAGRRWYWLNSQALTDSASALIPSNPAGRGYLPAEPALAGDGGPVGPIAGIPTYLDGAITTTAGAGSNQDVVVLTRPSDHLLLESTPNMTVNLEPLSGTLQARIVLSRYCAFLGGLYPTATAVVSGSGLTAPSGW